MRKWTFLSFANYHFTRRSFFSGYVTTNVFYRGLLTSHDKYNELAAFVLALKDNFERYAESLIQLRVRSHGKAMFLCIFQLALSEKRNRLVFVTLFANYDLVVELSSGNEEIAVL